MTKRIAVLATGGTIAGTGARPGRSATYEAAIISVEQLLATVPAVAEFAEMTCEQVSQVDSKEITLAIWMRLRDRVQVALDDPQVDGVVITHGTDTLEETAYWLHLTTGSEKPVVLTGAMRPSTALSADGPANLYDALAVAADPASRGKGVMVVMAARVHTARDGAKTSTDAITAFESGEAGVLGRICDGQVTWNRQGIAATAMHGQRMPLHGVARALVSLDALPRVDILLGYADVQRDVVDALVSLGTRGVVVAGCGNGSLNAAMRSGLTAAAASGISVVRATRVWNGCVIRNATEQDDAAGFVSAGCLSPWKARILLMLGLAMGHRGVGELQSLFDNG